MHQMMSRIKLKNEDVVDELFAPDPHVHADKREHENGHQ